MIKKNTASSFGGTGRDATRMWDKWLDSLFEVTPADLRAALLGELAPSHDNLTLVKTKTNQYEIDLLFYRDQQGPRKRSVGALNSEYVAEQEAMALSKEKKKRRQDLQRGTEDVEVDQEMFAEVFG